MNVENIYNVATAVVMVLVGLMLFYYISKLMLREKICGGYDQGCGCCGNETFVHKEITSNDLSKVAMGLNV
jgi:hypothetical protein